MPASDAELRLPTNAVIDSVLRRLFIAYASFGDVSNSAALSSAKFSKLWRDTGIIGHGLTTVDIDLVFVRTAQQATPASAASVACNLAPLLACVQTSS